MKKKVIKTLVSRPPFITECSYITTDGTVQTRHSSKTHPFVMNGGAQKFFSLMSSKKMM